MLYVAFRNNVTFVEKESVKRKNWYVLNEDNEFSVYNALQRHLDFCLVVFYLDFCLVVF